MHAPRRNWLWRGMRHRRTCLIAAPLITTRNRNAGSSDLRHSCRRSEGSSTRASFALSSCTSERDQATGKKKWRDGLTATDVISKQIVLSCVIARNYGCDLKCQRRRALQTLASMCPEYSIDFLSELPKTDARTSLFRFREEKFDGRIVRRIASGAPRCE